MNTPTTTQTTLLIDQGGPTPDLAELLQQYFGYGSFRPLQEEIIADTLAGRDALVLMPTGGGKSLCYQLPALTRPGLTVVVSPLIALMKDQVDALRRQGIPAALLNSTLDSRQLRDVMDGLRAGEYRMLYVAPERLMKHGFLSEVARLKPALFAIDEAHCISDWGHDFRPDYRQLRELRLRFPDVPMMALTATATERVRADIVTQLGLRDAGIYVASFNRPNLHYVVEPKKKAFERLVTLVRVHAGQSGIVYCGTRAGTENIAERLRAAGFKAASYHAGMETPDRATTQDAFLHDRVDIICATIAFGMGVNKPNIRFVVHYDLPKNIESYYQETGRAGRDGDPADCLLLFGPSDLITHERRIDEKTSAHEREIARQQLEGIMAFAESRKCRRRTLLEYFGEDYEPEQCGACDNCTGRSKVRAEAHPEEEATGVVEDRTQDARRFLACLDEITKASFAVGGAWVADVLAGSANEKIRKHGHESLKTFGRGRTVSKADWAAIAKELVRLDLVRRNPEKHHALEIEFAGRDFALGRTQITVEICRAISAINGDYDSALFERLRELRRRIADERQAPAFTVFSDVALRQMARDCPESPESFIRISGVGESKLRDLGDQFMKEISAHVREHGKGQFEAAPVVEPPPVAIVGRSERESLNRFQAGDPVEKIAKERNITPGTVYGHLARAALAGESVELARFLKPDEAKEIAAVGDEYGWGNLTAIHEGTGGRYDFNVLRIARCVLQPSAAAP